MGEWKRVKLGEIIECFDSMRKPLSSIQRSAFQGQYRYYGAQEVIDYVDGYIFDGTYVLIAEDGENLISRKKPIAQIVSGRFWLNNHAHIFKANEKSDLRYLCYFLNSSDITYYVTGSAQPKLSRQNLDSIELDLPPLPTQRRIAAVLGALDDKIEVNRKICENLEAQAQALFKAWFVDFEPFGGKRPEGWREVELPEVFYFQEGPGIRNWQYVTENGVRFINIRCIVDGDIWVDSANMISEEEANGKYSHFLLQENDIVMSCSGTLGRYAIVRKDHLPLCLNTSVIRFRPKNGFADFSWLYGYLGSEEFLSQQRALANGSVQANFGPTHLKNMKVMLPDAVTREKYHQAIYSSIQKAQTVREENKTLAAMRDALLPKLMSGELAVEKVEG